MACRFRPMQFVRFPASPNGTQQAITFLPAVLTALKILAELRCSAAGPIRPLRADGHQDGRLAIWPNMVLGETCCGSFRLDIKASRTMFVTLRSTRMDRCWLAVTHTAFQYSTCFPPPDQSCGKARCHSSWANAWR